MNLLEKVRRNLDYSNPYTVKRAMGILDSEFASALEDNRTAAEDIYHTAQLIYNEMFALDTKGLWTRRMREFVSHLETQLKR